ncbi:L,D-transpeptidase [Ectobacillus funiculus]|uniref:L,D-transpeptidase n=1 Tax=Ectobacillus funiculus TaxID=137993 RepID=UPI0024829BAC|nr:L,D-transpeptidase [Ectobacillus funiculus]
MEWLSNKIQQCPWLFYWMMCLVLFAGVMAYSGVIKPQAVSLYQTAVELPSRTYSLPSDEEVLRRYMTPVPEQLIIINRATNELALFENGHLVKKFIVATGKSSTPTPTGKFPIVNKIKNRPFYKLNIPGGDPRNPLGDRWIGLDIDGTNGTTYAIHGNSNASTIGRYVSNGCIRMYNSDVQELFERVHIGTMVIIQDFTGPWDAVAMEHGYKLYS